MATKAETNAVYAAGLVQGIALVTFPAASTIFTNPQPVRPVQHPVRDHIPATGGDRDHRFSAGREPGCAVRDQTGAPGRRGGGPGVSRRKAPAGPAAAAAA
jgi:hypothetical protein